MSVTEESSPSPRVRLELSIPMDRATLTGLRREARVRGVRAERLAGELLEVLVEDSLFVAILDR